jgi:hypothetical protein
MSALRSSAFIIAARTKDGLRLAAWYAEVVLALNCGGAEMMLLLLFQPQTKAAVATVWLCVCAPFTVHSFRRLPAFWLEFYCTFCMHYQFGWLVPLPFAWCGGGVFLGVDDTNEEHDGIWLWVTMICLWVPWTYVSTWRRLQNLRNLKRNDYYWFLRGIVPFVIFHTPHSFTVVQWEIENHSIMTSKHSFFSRCKFHTNSQ